MKKNVALPDKWSGFISHIQKESHIFKEILKRAEEDKENCNKDFSTFSKKSFQTIHRTTKDRSIVPAIKEKKTIARVLSNNPKEPKPSILPIEYDYKPTNQYKWPKRMTSAKRLLVPEKLNDYPPSNRKKDIHVISGKIVVNMFTI